MGTTLKNLVDVQIDQLLHWVARLNSDLCFCLLLQPQDASQTKMQIQNEIEEAKSTITMVVDLE